MDKGIKKDFSDDLIEFDEIIDEQLDRRTYGDNNCLEKELKRLSEIEDFETYTHMINKKNIITRSNFKKIYPFLDWSILIVPSFTPMDYIEKHKHEINWEVNLGNLYNSKRIDIGWLEKLENHFILKHEYKTTLWWNPDSKFLVSFQHFFEDYQIEALKNVPLEIIINRPHLFDLNEILMNSQEFDYSSKELQTLRNLNNLKYMFEEKDR